jgi:hypothetical protein
MDQYPPSRFLTYGKRSTELLRLFKCPTMSCWETTVSHMTSRKESSISVAWKEVSKSHTNGVLHKLWPDCIPEWQDHDTALVSTAENVTVTAKGNKTRWRRIWWHKWTESWWSASNRRLKITQFSIHKYQKIKHFQVFLCWLLKIFERNLTYLHIC